MARPKKPVAKAAEVKEEVMVAEAVVEAPVEVSVEEAPAKPATKKSTTRKSAAKKTTEKKVAEKKSAENKTTRKTAPKANIFIQYQGTEVSQADLIEKAKADAGVESPKNINLYVKPEDNMVYYVIDEKVGGFVLA